MTRFEGDGDEDFPGQWWLWEANMQRHFSGAEGQKILREIREALLALPEKRLISTRLADEHGNVCTLGALAVKRGLEQGEWREVVLGRLEALVTEELAEWDSWEVEEQTLAVAKDLGVKPTMAIEVGWQNDMGHHEETPEQRYERVLAWVENCILVPA